jgi:hypothetical protein
MNYTEAKNLYDRRRNKASRRRYDAYALIAETPDGLRFEYEDGVPIATISPESVWTMHLEITPREAHGKMLLQKIVGKAINVSHNSASKCRNKLRFKVWCVAGDVGYKPGLQYDAINRKVLNAEPDDVLLMDKAKYKEAKPLLDLTKRLTAVLLRMSGPSEPNHRLHHHQALKMYLKEATKLRDACKDGVPIDDTYDFTPLIEAALRVQTMRWYGEPTEAHKKAAIGAAQAVIRKELKNVLGVYKYQSELIN